MKYFLKLLILLILSFLFSFQEIVNILPVDKYGERKINDFSSKNIGFSLDIREIKNNDKINLQYSSSSSVDESTILYYWANEIYTSKNFTKIPAKKNHYCGGSSTSEDFMKGKTYTKYCNIEKENNYNTLIIIVNKQKSNGFSYTNFQITHTKYDTSKIILIIVLCIFASIFIVIIIASIYICCRRINKIPSTTLAPITYNDNNQNYNYNNNQYNFNNNATPNYNQNNYQGYNYQGNNYQGYNYQGNNYQGYNYH